MPTDRTRPSDDRRQGYRGVRFQQGRVILDRDLNAAEELTAEELRDVTRDVVGPVGTPDNGFMIAPVTNKTETKHRFDFTIAAGTYYVGGVRVSFDQPATYFNQPAWLHPDWISKKEENSRLSQEWSEFIYLQVQEVEVSAQEDPDLKDVGLGGPDTAGRLSLLVRVVRMLTNDAQDCKEAFKILKERWAQGGYQFDEKTNQLLPQGSLKVGFSSAAQTTLCQPQASGAYLHPNNQNIRIKSVQVKDTQQLLWGFDNASFLYRVDTHSNSRTLKLTTLPPDSTRFPKSGQFVEVLRTTAKLPNGGFIAEPEGFVTMLSTGYDSEAGTVILADDLPTEIVNSTTPLFVRIWENTLSVPADKASLDAISDPSGPTGLTITVPAMASPLGSYWTFAPRPETPQRVYPERYVENAQPPDGPKVWVAPLAFLKWAKKGELSHESVSDCREQFDNLVELTRNRSKSTTGGCCEITVTPDDVNQTDGLNGLFKRLRSERTGRLHVCFRPGVYFLREPLYLTEDFRGVILNGCPGTQWEVPGDVRPDMMLDGMLVLAGCENVTVKGIYFVPPGIPMLPAFEARKVSSSATRALRKDFSSALSAVAIRAINAKQLKVDDCEFSFPINQFAVFASAVFAHGDCTGLQMTNCRIAQSRENFDDPNAGAMGELSRNHLRQLAVAIHSYVEVTQKPPQTLGDLLPFVDNSAKPFIHPATGKSPPPELSTDQLAEWVNTNADYVYLTIDGRSALIASRVLLFEKTIVGMTRVNVALGDGSVRSLDFDLARDLIAKSGGQLIGVAAASGTRGWFGLLACHQRLTIDENQQVIYTHRPILDDVVLAENNFVGLSVPFLGIGDIGTITVRSNHASDCTGGVWFTPPEAIELMKSFPETKFSAAVIDAFPLLLSRQVPDATSRPLDFAVNVHNNHLNATPNEPVAAGPTVCLFGDPPPASITASAVASDMIIKIPRVNVLYRRAQRLAADRQTAILTGNNLAGVPQSSQDLSFTTVFVALMDGVSVNGNIIENYLLPQANPAALVIFPRSGRKTPGNHVAVTGNIFRGSTNLDSLKRSNDRPSWRDYNSEFDS